MPGSMPHNTTYDLAFNVPFVHRVRFTDDVLGPDADVLLSLLPADDFHPDTGPCRVLACVEAAVDASAGTADRLRALAAANPSRLELLGPEVLEGGEALKNEPRRLLPLLERVLACGIDRQSVVLAVGGGAFLDAVGFAAALAHRGVRLIRLPTTTMGQADSGVGVKNAINFFGRKNWLGTFAVPHAVVNDAALLQTLPARDFRAGFSEAVKVALLKDARFFQTLERTASQIARRDPAASAAALRGSAHWHLMHITGGGDPFETRQARPLDFGHWSAHRLEAMTHFALRHGEAVSTGVAIDCVYSREALGLPAETCRRVLATLAALGLPLAHPQLADEDALLEGLEEFRQHLGGRLTLTMLRDVAEPIDVHTVNDRQMRHAIREVRQGSR